MNTHNNNHESTTQVGNPYLAGGSIPPPPPPERLLPPRRGLAASWLSLPASGSSTLYDECKIESFLLTAKQFLSPQFPNELIVKIVYCSLFIN